MDLFFCELLLLRSNVTSKLMNKNMNNIAKLEEIPSVSLGDVITPYLFSCIVTIVVEIYLLTKLRHLKKNEVSEKNENTLSSEESVNQNEGVCKEIEEQIKMCEGSENTHSSEESVNQKEGLCKEIKEQIKI